MKVLIGGNTYFVNFRHVQEGGEIIGAKLKSLGNSKPIRSPLVRHTECKVLQEIEGKEIPGFISIGYARCHPDDNFNKEKGRQLALKKALEDAEFSKHERVLFWTVYRNWGTERF